MNAYWKGIVLGLVVLSAPVMAQEKPAVWDLKPDGAICLVLRWFLFMYIAFCTGYDLWYGFYCYCYYSSIYCSRE